MVDPDFDGGWIGFIVIDPGAGHHPAVTTGPDVAGRIAGQRPGAAVVVIDVETADVGVTGAGDQYFYRCVEVHGAVVG